MSVPTEVPSARLCQFIVDHFRALRCGEPAYYLTKDAHGDDQEICLTHAMRLIQRGRIVKQLTGG